MENNENWKIFHVFIHIYNKYSTIHTAIVSMSTEIVETNEKIIHCDHVQNGKILISVCSIDVTVL